VSGDPCVEEIGEPAVRNAHREPVDEHLIAARDHGLRDRRAELDNRTSLRRLERSQVQARERGVHVQLRPRAEPAESAGVGGCRQRRVVKGHDHPHAVAAIPREPREVGRRMHLHKHLLDHASRRSIDGAGRRPGSSDDCEEGGEER
jgi:hypothetical protein